MRSALSYFSSGILCISFLNLLPSRVQADPATQPTSGPATTTASAIAWNQAAKHIGETLTITGPVMGTHITAGGKALVLNVGKDFPDPSRFSVMISTDASHKATASDFQGKNITVTGKIDLYRGVAEVKVNPADVIVEKLDKIA